jgi:hypothetical protein
LIKGAITHRFRCDRNVMHKKEMTSLWT